MDTEKKNRTVPVLVAVVVIALLIGLIVWALNMNNNDGNADVTNRDNTAVVEDEKESTLTKILDDPENFIGKEVTVTAEVQDVFTNRVFKISNDVVGDELLVVAPQALTDKQAKEAEEFLADNANVRVTGTIRRATVSEVERDYSLTLDPQVEVEFENKLILVADTITFTDQSDSIWDFDVNVPDVDVNVDSDANTNTNNQ